MNKKIIGAGLVLAVAGIACARTTGHEDSNTSDIIARVNVKAHLIGEWSEGNDFNGSTLTFKSNNKFERVTQWSAEGFVGRGGGTLPHGETHDSGTYSVVGNQLTLKFEKSDAPVLADKQLSFAVRVVATQEFQPEEITLTQLVAPPPPGGAGSHIAYPAITYQRDEGSACESVNNDVDGACASSQEACEGAKGTVESDSCKNSASGGTVCCVGFDKADDDGNQVTRHPRPVLGVPKPPVGGAPINGSPRIEGADEN
jgi:hypothetical protein